MIVGVLAEERRLDVAEVSKAPAESWTNVRRLTGVKELPRARGQQVGISSGQSEFYDNLVFCGDFNLRLTEPKPKCLEDAEPGRSRGRTSERNEKPK